MSNIQIEMNFYSFIGKYAVMVLFDDEKGVRSSICIYPKNKREAKKALAAMENQYGVTGSINEQ